MSRMFRSALRRLIAPTRWGRQRLERDPFFAARKLITASAPVIFDVGAHTGETAARYRATFPEAIIHSFEPFPASLGLLATRFAADKNVHIHATAVADKTGTATLHVNSASVTNSLLAPDARAARYWGAELFHDRGAIDVPTVSLDDFCAAAGVGRVDVLKIDVQGAEYAVVTGARNLLGRHAVDVIYMEIIVGPSYVGQKRYHYYLTALEELGYQLFDVFNLGRHHGRLLQFDGLFVSPSTLERYERARS